MQNRVGSEELSTARACRLRCTSGSYPWAVGTVNSPALRNPKNSKHAAAHSMPRYVQHLCMPRPVTIILLCIQYIVVSISNFMVSCRIEEENVFTLQSKRSLLLYHLLGMQDFPRGSATCGTPSMIKIFTSAVNLGKLF